MQVAPEHLKAGLDRLAFEDRLGSMADRANRIAAIVRAIALPGKTGTPLVALTNQERDTLARAAELAKFDLASQMVIELTSLAGVMAREYARRAGESETVSQALFEMELPRSAGDALPETTPGALLALADRLDLLVGLFGIGATPTGSSDPFGLRRAALGVVNILRSFPVLRDITALQRVRRIVPTGTVSSYHPDKLSEPTEVALHDALRKVSAVVEENSTLGEFADAADALTNPINAFFDGVLVMADDPEVRNTRLGLLASICELAGTVIDWQALGTAGR